jgi:hypothetical protein
LENLAPRFMISPNKRSSMISPWGYELNGSFRTSTEKTRWPTKSLNTLYRRWSQQKKEPRKDLAMGVITGRIMTTGATKVDNKPEAQTRQYGCLCR